MTRGTEIRRLLNSRCKKRNCADCQECLVEKEGKSELQIVNEELEILNSQFRKIMEE